MNNSPKNSPALSGLLNRQQSKEDSIGLAARTMAQLSHPERLRLLCHLIEEGELSVAQLLQRIPLSPSALSQHLARMREDGLISARREGKRVYYVIQREDIREIISLLHRLYCPPDGLADPKSRELEGS